MRCYTKKKYQENYRPISRRRKCSFRVFFSSAFTPIFSFFAHWKVIASCSWIFSDRFPFNVCTHVQTLLGYISRFRGILKIYIWTNAPSLLFSASFRNFLPGNPMPEHGFRGFVPSLEMNFTLFRYFCCFSFRDILLYVLREESFIVPFNVDVGRKNLLKQKLNTLFFQFFQFFQFFKRC